jgi:hypothetical protein
MDFEQIEQRHQQAMAYCRQCTDLQLENIIEVETKRIKGHGEGEIVEIAKIMMFEAKREIERRQD